MLLFKIVKNNFKKNFKNYLLFFSCSILTIMIFFISFGIMEYIVQFSNGVQSGSERTSVYFVYFALIGVANIIFLSISLRYYLKTRISDYSILVILGSKKELVLKLVFAEYFSVWLLAFLIGTLLGNIGIFFLYNVLEHYHLFYHEIYFPVMKVYGETFITTILLFGISILFILLRLMKSDLSSLFILQESRERVHKKTSFLAVAGIVLIAYSFWYLREYSIGRMLLSVSFTVIGCYILISYGGSLFLQLVQLNKKYYYRHILNYSEFSYRFSQNKKTIFIFFIINFIVIFLSAGQLFHQFLCCNMIIKKNILIIVLNFCIIITKL